MVCGSGGGVAACRLVLCYLLTCVIWARCHYTSDECDWIGSGLPHDPQVKSVKQLYLRCSRGHVDWDYAYGAIRITFQDGTSGRDFQGCIKPASHFSGASVYVQGKNKLELVVHPQQQGRDDGSTGTDSKQGQISRTYCFDSRDGKATLFVEAMPNVDGKRKTVSFDYSLELKNRNSKKDVFKDCRPCNETELMTAFCASDFVIKSKIAEVSDDRENEETHIKLSIGHIYNQAENIFTEVKPGRYTGTVVMPLKCGVRHGEGHFLMTGSVRLGKYRLLCAPRFSEFRKLARAMTERGLNECDMSEVIHSTEN
ncbi:meteorin-like protein [Ptychodera flava]|uniref:meteorin-like protein n=1 Tax=Ptychodera flava TaxID=63121 RepID=UPI003969E0A8